MTSSSWDSRNTGTSTGTTRGSRTALPETVLEHPIVSRHAAVTRRRPVDLRATTFTASL
jgi:hypothetical protein